jgi:hypothetical protein
VSCFFVGWFSVGVFILVGFLCGIGGGGVRVLEMEMNLKFYLLNNARVMILFCLF